MKTTKILAILVLALVLLFCGAEVSWALQMSTAFTYQGHLYDSNSVADGLYDFQFKLYDANSGPNQVGSDVNKPDIDVIDGYFTVELDFNDTNAFNGDARWLEIGVRPGASTGSFATLSPRREITATPYAMHASNIQVVPGGVGVVPVGGVVAWLKSFPNTPALPNNFVECNGQPCTDPNSPFNGQTIPNLNGDSGGTQRFLRGATNSGNTGGTESHAHIQRNSSSWRGMSSGYWNPALTGDATEAESTLPSYYEVVWIIRIK